MQPSLIFLLRTFKYWNDTAFDSELGLIPIRVTKARSYKGIFRVRTTVRGGRKSYYPSIAISSFFDESEDAIVDTLIHEMIHFQIWLKGIRDTSPHGDYFRRRMNEINRRFGRHITISTKVTSETHRTSSQTIVSPLIVCTMTDGRRLVCVPAVSRLKELYNSMRANFRGVEKVEFAITTDSRLGIYPRVRTPKLYAIDSDVLDEILANAIERR